MGGSAVIAGNVISGLLLGGMFALSALGLSLVLGVLRLVNLAHGVFLVFGAYAGFYWLHITGIDPLAGLPVIALAAALIAAPVYRLIIQPVMVRAAEAPMMTTFGIAVIMENLFVLVFSADTRSIETSYSTAALQFLGVTVPRIYLIGFAISVAAILGVHALLERSAFGRDLRAAAQDPIAAAIVGVDVTRVQMVTFALGAVCAGVGGTITGLAFAFTPTSGPGYLLNSFAVVVLGGLGDVFGTLIAGITIGALQSLGGMVFGDGYRDLVALVIFLLVLVVRPRGLAPSRR